VKTSNLTWTEVFNSRSQREYFGCERDEATNDRRKLHKEELHNLYSSPIVIRIISRMRCVGQGEPTGEVTDGYSISIGESEWKEVTWVTSTQMEDY
jgi:hypothetical protein